MLPGDQQTSWEETIGIVKRHAGAIRRLPHVTDVAAFGRHGRGRMEQFGIVVRVDSQLETVRQATLRLVQEMLGSQISVEVAYEGWWRALRRGKSSPPLQSRALDN